MIWGFIVAAFFVGLISGAYWYQLGLFATMFDSWTHGPCPLCGHKEDKRFLMAVPRK